MDALTTLAGSNLAAYFLVVARIGGLFSLAPVFASRVVPTRIRLLLALAVSLVCAPQAAKRPIPLDVVTLAPLFVKEVLVGAALAFAVAGVYAAVELAGSLIDTSIGFSFANVVDPALNFQSSVISQFYGLIASTIFLATGAHLVLISGVVRSFQLLPVDESPDLSQLAELAVHGIAPLFVIAVEIASPVVATLLLTDVAFGFLARLVPQLQPFAVQFSIKILAGLAVVGLSLPVTMRIVEERFADTLSATGILPGP